MSEASADAPLSAVADIDWDRDPCVHWEACETCGGDGCHEYEGDPLDDYIDADPTVLVTCRDCGGRGTVPVCSCQTCDSGGCCA